MTDPETAAAKPAPPRIQRGLSGPALLAAYVIIALFPLVLALIAGKPARSFWRELASGLAMVGFAMLLLEFMLSGRYRGVSGRVGIDVTMRVHQLAAWGILLFLLAHPFLYAVPRLTPEPMRAVAAIERMFTSEWYRSGVIAWLILLLMVPLAAWRDRLPISYETWRASHGLGAALVAGLGLHHTLEVFSHSADPWLSRFWAILAGLALLTLVHAYLVKPLLQRRRPFRVVSNRQVAERSFELVIRPDQDHSFHFLAGQFVWLKLGRSPFSLTEHPFSISSAPADLPNVAFTIKQSGDFTNRIGEVPLGTRALVDGLKLVLSDPPPGWPGLTGELTEHVLDTGLDPECRQRWTHFVCGPPPMMSAVEHSLLRFGVPAGNIIAERFKYD